MQKYILITHDKIKFVLSESEAAAILDAINSNKKQAIIQGEVIPLSITPTIIKFERWYAQENQRLALTNYRLCKLCLSVMRIDDVCACWKEKGKGEDKNAFVEPMLPESVLDGIKRLAQTKSFPKLQEGDLEEEMLNQKKIITGEDSVGEYFISEDEEKLYS